MNKKPLVSVIIAAYNVERYIEQAVRSVLGQSLENTEVIVINDASTDGTDLVMQKIHDPRVKLFHNESNMGPSFSRNLGIMHAEGEWIAILDADDWWESNRLEALLEVAEHEGAHIVCDDLYLIQDGAESPWNTYLKSRERAIGRIADVTTVPPVKMIADDYGLLQPIIRMDFLNKSGARYKEHLVFAEDYVFMLDCLIYGAKMVIFPQAYYYYRSRTGSLVNSSSANAQARHGLLLELLKNKPYNQFPDVIDALHTRLRRVSLALQEIRVIETFRQSGLLRAASVLVTNPALLMQYARRLKRSIVG